MNKIRIVIVDDFEDIRNHFKMILARETDMEVVATASSGAEGYEVVMQHQPDIVLMDVQMETEMAGIETTRKIKEQMDAIKVIVLTIHEEDEILFKAYGAGAIDYIVKTSSIVEILNSIRNVYNNKLSLRPEVAGKIITEFARLQNEQSNLVGTLNVMSKLTNTEFIILKAIYGGKTYQQIAKERFVEEVTIRTQVNKILKKFEKQSMKEVIKALKELRIFDIYGDKQ